MKSARSLSLLTAALCISAAMLAATPNRHGGGGTQTTVAGDFAVTFNVNIASTLPSGSTLLCKAQVVPSRGYGDGGLQGTSAPVETAASLATVSGSTATCTVDIPFSWTISNSQSQALLSYEIDAVNASGALPALVRASAQQNIPEPLPAGGGTSAATLNITF